MKLQGSFEEVETRFFGLACLPGRERARAFTRASAHSQLALSQPCPGLRVGHVPIGKAGKPEPGEDLPKVTRARTCRRHLFKAHAAASLGALPATAMSPDPNCSWDSVGREMGGDPRRAHSSLSPPRRSASYTCRATRGPGVFNQESPSPGQWVLHLLVCAVSRGPLQDSPAGAQAVTPFPDAQLQGLGLCWDWNHLSWGFHCPCPQ